MAIGVYGTTHDAEIIQLGLGCATTQPALREQRLLGAPGRLGTSVTLPTPTPAPLHRAGLLTGKQTTALRLAPAQTFAPPLNKDGTRLDACQFVGGQPCGQAPADAFCRAQGFARAQSFESGMERVHAETLGGQKCTAFHCSVFRKIECVR